MSRNLHEIDRYARLAVGALPIVLAATGVIGWWGYLGVIFVATGFVNFCPVYKVLGIKTCQDC